MQAVLQESDNEPPVDVKAIKNLPLFPYIYLRQYLLNKVVFFFPFRGKIALTFTSTINK
jgi:hypothetical protein